MTSLSVHVVLSREEEKRYIAHCLEFDLVAQGESLLEAFKNLLDAIEVQAAYAQETGDLGHLFNPAPVECWKVLALDADSCRFSQIIFENLQNLRAQPARICVLGQYPRAIASIYLLARDRQIPALGKGKPTPQTGIWLPALSLSKGSPLSRVDQSSLNAIALANTLILS